MNNRVTIRATFFGALLLALPLDALAYLDPGTGSAIIQGIIAAASALLVTAHLYWARLTHWFHSLGKRSATSPKTDPQPPVAGTARREPEDQ